MAVGLAAVRDRIAAACATAGVSRESITLVAVSKHRSTDDVLRVHADGQRIFGENREQELRVRIAASLPRDIAWHFVGPLQRRKVPFVAEHAALLHSMDRMSLAQEWVRRGGGPALVQFNLGSEPQKSGFDPAEAARTLDAVLSAGVAVRGVMAIPPMSADPEDSRPWFAALRRIFDGYVDVVPDITVCSMGMSLDLEVAIEEGATMVRIGRAIFEDTNPSGR